MKKTITLLLFACISFTSFAQQQQQPAARRSTPQVIYAQKLQQFYQDADAANADAKTKAEELLNQWKSGEATEESFGTLAAINTADTGSADTGGLYENVKQGDMVTEFNDWCFDAARKAGDTGIVETTYGYHIMYFVSTGDAAWKVQARDEMMAADLDTYGQSLIEGLEAVELSGMKYVG